MSRLYDRVLRYGLRVLENPMPDFFERDFKRMQNGVPVILANNVTEYFYAQTENEDWQFGRDIPNLAPPFRRFFIESRKPSGVLTQKGFTPWSSRLPHAWGLFVQADDFKEECPKDLDWRENSIKSLARTTSKMFDQNKERYFKGTPVEPARWFLHSGFFYEMPGSKPGGPIMTQFAAIKEDGVPARTSEGEQLIWGMPMTSDPREQRFYGEEAGKMSLPLWLAVAFTHCKNVHLDQHEPIEKVSRKHERKHGQPLTRYYTLEIGAMTDVLERRGAASEAGLKRALHICRGHFATYSEEKPLFGKYAGTFWKPQHVKGSKRHGEVVKDYSVKTP